ncbi:MAG TPA: hypothetical protein DD456_06520 [Stenotrophomonas sp.]|nr:hypothetical protein [Stenotrophomonas sp.]
MVGAAEGGAGCAAAQADGGDVATPADAAQSPVRQSWSQAPAVRREKIEGPGYTWVEAGVARLDVDLYDAGEHGNGGYARGSVAVAEGLYVFGGYDRVSRDWNMGARQLEVAIDQAEIGLGASLSLSPRADFISELSLLRLGAKLDYRDGEYPQDDISGRDHLYAGKLMLGIRARLARNMELWAKAGYLRVDDNLLVDHSMVGNVGLQYRFTPEWPGGRSGVLRGRALLPPGRARQLLTGKPGMLRRDRARFRRAVFSAAAPGSPARGR